MIDSYIYLVKRSASGQTDEFAQPIETITETAVLATAVPVSRSEYYSAGQLGIMPEFEFVINPAEYSGESEIRIVHNGVDMYLRVYRVYRRSADEIELYCARSAGMNTTPEPKPEPTQNENGGGANENN